MFTVRYGGKQGRAHNLVESSDLVAVRTVSREPVMAVRPFGAATVSQEARQVLDNFDLEARFHSAGVDILRSKVARKSEEKRDTARAILKKEAAIEFAGRVLVDAGSKAPVLYTENLFVKFVDDISATAARKFLKTYDLKIKSEVEFARNGYFVSAPENIGLDVFALAEKILDDHSVEYCHPELIREVRSRGAFAQQWHLKKTTISGKSIDAHASIEAAWTASRGEGTIIAIIDDGVDIDHEELRSSGKIVAPVNVSLPENNANRTNPRPGSGDDHGTACAGVACANGLHGASGVAPGAKLMPIRLVSGLGSMAEANAFMHAARNGADVISCSWGPADGKWWDASDPLHKQVVPLPDSTRLAIDWAVNNGRNGRGCVIVWAAGNGNESVDNDGYASYANVIAVAACNDLNTRSAYSDFGGAIWCAFPSSNGNPSNTPGIWTTDRMGASGYNLGRTDKGDAAGHYTNSFGGTSSAAPGVAGLAALIIARNPQLRWDEVRDIIKRSCDRIDTANAAYDSNGRSRLYGFGRVNGVKAVELAMPPKANHSTIHTAVRDVAIQDMQTSQLALNVCDTDTIADIHITVDIEHTYIGDLIVTLTPPAGSGGSDVVLHNREGGGTDNLKKTYDTVNASGLAGLIGRKPQGTWTLKVSDNAKTDTGRIRSFTVELRF